MCSRFLSLYKTRRLFEEKINSRIKAHHTIVFNKQYAWLYLLESKIGDILALETTQQALYFNPGFLSKLNIDLAKKPASKDSAYSDVFIAM